MSRCRVCLKDGLADALAFGPQPLSNRFLKTAVEKEFMFPLSMGVCGACGVVQLFDIPPAEEMRPRFDWITYNEPEGHLDALVDVVVKLPGVSLSSTIAALTFKDDSTLRRMAEKGFKRQWRLDPKNDLGIAHPQAGIETIQEKWTKAAAREVKKKRGGADVFFVRHIFEHARDLREFCAGLKEILNPGGIIILELPDCRRALEKKDYSTVWEEHATYFTDDTFRGSLEILGFETIHFQSFPYSLENSLVAVVRPAANAAGASSRGGEEKARLFGEFSKSFSRRQTELQNELTRFQREHGPVAVMGAGHLSCTFVNLMKLEKLVAFFVDDNPNKKGLFMPGSRLPIVGSSALMEKRVKLCLMGVSPESAEKIRKNNQPYLQSGGVFKLIFDL